MIALRHLRDQLFHHDIEHGSGSKTEQIRQRRDNELCRQNRQHGADGLYHAGKHAAAEGSAFFHALRPQRHGDDRPFREVLNGDAQRQGQRTGRRDLRAAGAVPGVYHADGHALRDVVQRHGQHHHRRALQAALRPFGLGAVRVQVRDDVIQCEQKQDAEPEAQKGGEERELPHTCRLLDRRDQQAPDRSRHHHTGGETGQRALHGVTERFLHKEHACRAQRGAEKRDQDPPKCLHKTASFLLWIRLFSQVRHI